MSGQEFECAIPILNIRNFAASMDYYVNKLGFSKKWDWGTPPTFGAVKRGKVEIFFCEGAQGRPGTWISVFVENVDDLYQEYQKRDAKILNSPANMPWGLREMVVEDLDGHRLRMGSDATGPVDPAEVKRIWDTLQFPDRKPAQP
ncbi:MAG TPA: bleomycin resistance family protein [Terriglobales bacterium]|nr:bleomycin resistance family protein [Terriglobales bacterium]